jgi:outer membrane protein assembly factor BamB
VDLAGKKTTLVENWSERGLAWAPDGNEIWYTATKRGGESGRALYAVTLDGKERLILKEPALLSLQDISRDGRLLLSHDTERRGILGRGLKDTQERDWSWFDRSYARDLSPDGMTVLFDETGESARPDYVVYLRRLDGSLPVRLGVGVAQSLSSDGKWALANKDGKFFALPTGAGEAVPIEPPGLEITLGRWVPNRSQLLLLGREPGKPVRNWLMDFPAGKPQPLTPEGTAGAAISPDGKLLVAGNADGTCALYRLDGGAPQPIACLQRNPIRWLSDNRSVLIREGDMPAMIYRVDVLTGRKEPWRELMPADRGGTYRLDGTHFSADGKAYVYTYRRVLSDLYVVEGLK